MIAPCGIDCENCSIYKASMDKSVADKLTEQWRNAGHKDATAIWFKCRGCRGEDKLIWSPDCRIRKCCMTIRRLDNCSFCDDFPCEIITKFENDPFPHHKEAVENLRKMKKK